MKNVSSKTMELSDAVLSVLKKRPRSNEEIRMLLNLTSYGNDQKLNRALQRLRREGKLKLLNGRWAVAVAGICSTCGGRGWVAHAPVP